MRTFILSIVLLFCMIGTSESITYRQTFRVGGPVIYPPIIINYGWYGYAPRYAHRRYGGYGSLGYTPPYRTNMIHCSCGRWHLSGSTCWREIQKSYYYNRRQNEFTSRRQDFNRYYDVDDLFKKKNR